MLDGLLQQFAGGGAQNLEGQDLHGGVGQLLQGAESGHVMGAVQQALGAMGPQGFGSSVAQGTQQASPEQRTGLMNTLLSAVEQGGGSTSNALAQSGAGGGNAGPGELGALAEHVMSNHPDALAGVLGSQLSGGGGGGGMLSLLGNPMVRQVGMQLAQRML